MIVECIVSDPRDKTLLTEQQKILKDTFPFSNSQVMLTLGRQYCVYAIKANKGFVDYYIIDDFDLDYPTPYPGFMFDIIDDRMSVFWNTKAKRYKESMLVKGNWLAPAKWKEEGDTFYEHLLENCNNEIAEFMEIREKMCLEFATSHIEMMAISLVDGWNQCPRCEHAWKNETTDELIRCPECHQIMRCPSQQQ